MASRCDIGRVGLTEFMEPVRVREMKTKSGITFLRYLPKGIDSIEGRRHFVLFNGFGIDNTNYAGNKFFEKLVGATRTADSYFSPGFAGSDGRRGYIDEETSMRRMREAHEEITRGNPKEVISMFHSLASPEGSRFYAETHPERDLPVKGIVHIAAVSSLEDVLDLHPIWKWLYKLGAKLPGCLFGVPAPYLFANPDYHSFKSPKIGAKKWVKARDAKFIQDLDTREDAGKVYLPQLFVVPEKDIVVHPDYQRRLATEVMMDVIPRKDFSVINAVVEDPKLNNIRCETVCEAGHNVMRDAPEESARLILDWLRKNRL